MGAAFLIGPLAPADRSQLGSHSGNADGYLRSAVGLGLKTFSQIRGRSVPKPRILEESKKWKHRPTKTKPKCPSKHHTFINEFIKK